MLYSFLAIAQKGLFLVANWSVLAPVGGITIYEDFELNLHPMRLQVDARVGRRIMEYVWPARRNRPNVVENGADEAPEDTTKAVVPSRSSMDSPRSRRPTDESLNALEPPLRKVSASRSVTDLRATSLQVPPPPPSLHRTRSSGGLRRSSGPSEISRQKSRNDSSKVSAASNSGDAAEMKTRSSQKSFVLVRITRYA